MTASSPAPAVTRAVALLELLAVSGRPMALTDLARGLGAPKSSTANLCAALESSGMIRRVDGRWGLGPKLVELGQSFLDGTDLVREFQGLCAQSPVLAAETTLLATMDGTDVLYLGRHDGAQPVPLASRVGRRLPAAVTAVGKAMLSRWNEADVDRWLGSVGDLPVLTSRSLRSHDELRADLRRSAERGFAVDDQQNTEGVMCFAVAVPRPGQGAPDVGLSVTLLAVRVTETLRDGIVQDLRAVAARLANVAGP